MNLNVLYSVRHSVRGHLLSENKHNHKSDDRQIRSQEESLRRGIFNLNVVDKSYFLSSLFNKLSNVLDSTQVCCFLR